MTKRTDSGETITINLRDIAKVPAVWLGMLAAAGLGGGGSSVLERLTKSGPTVEDFQRLERKVDAIDTQVARLVVESEGRKWAESHKTVSAVP